MDLFSKRRLKGREFPSFQDPKNESSKKMTNPIIEYDMNMFREFVTQQEKINIWAGLLSDTIVGPLLINDNCRNL